jgi:transcriptional regulator CtsR
VDITKDKYIMHIINSVGSNLSQQEVDILIRNFLEYGVISQLEAKLLKVATSDKVLNLPVELKDIVRTRIFKNMLINLI